MATVASSRIIRLQATSPRYTPTTSSVLWSNITGTGKPADYATVGAPTGTYVGSTAATTVESNAANAVVGNITVGSSCAIKGGQTGFNSGNGFFLGWDSTAYKFSIGNSTNKLSYDGSELAFSGVLDCRHATLRTRELAPPGQMVEMVQFKVASGETFGKILQENAFNGSYAHKIGGTQFNFSASTNLAGSFIGASNTDNDTHARLAVTSDGHVWRGTSSDGSTYTWTQMPVCDNTTQSNLKSSDSDRVDGYHAGNSSGQVAISNGSMCTNLSADMVDGYHAGNSSGYVSVSNGTVCTNLNADMVDGYHVGATGASGTIPVSNSNWQLNLAAQWAYKAQAIYDSNWGHNLQPGTAGGVSGSNSPSLGSACPGSGAPTWVQFYIDGSRAVIPMWFY
jgi:hypothetical protein